MKGHDSRERHPFSAEWLRVYADQWLEDKSLSRCSMAAQGTLARIVQLMGWNDCYEIRLELERLVFYINCSVAEWRKATSELEKHGHIEISQHGYIITVRTRWSLLKPPAELRLVK